MRELEEHISQWRRALPSLLQAQPSIVAELEEHLREQTERLQREGMSVDAAFAAALKRLGAPDEIAREFDRVHAASLPRSPFLWVALLLAALVLVAVNSLLTWQYIRGKLTLLLFVHVAIVSTGYLLVFGNGLLGLCALLRSWRSPAGLAEQREMRRVMYWLSIAASVFVPGGIALGIAWASENLDHAWSWRPVEIGALLVLGSSWLLLLAQTRFRVSDQARAFLAIVGAVATAVGFAAKALTPVVSVGWLGIALILIQCTLFWSRRDTVTPSAE